MCMQCVALSRQTQKSLSLFQGLNPSYEIKKNFNRVFKTMAKPSWCQH